jgi:hypothetical protein
MHSHVAKMNTTTATAPVCMPLIAILGKFRIVKLGRNNTLKHYNNICFRYLAAVS